MNNSDVGSIKDRLVLIVDDEPLLREVLREEFEISGAKVLEAEGGRAAIELVRKNPDICAVVSDLRMPDGDGFTLLKEIRKINHSIPVTVLITGYSDLTPEEAYDEGADGVFSKPMNFENIVFHIEKMLSPWSRRYCQPSPPMHERFQLRVVEENLMTISQKIGRGGFSIGTAGKVELGDIIGVQISLQNEENLGQVHLQAVCRWRKFSSKSSNAGFEFTSIPAEFAVRLEAAIHLVDRRAFIPLEPLSVAV